MPQGLGDRNLRKCERWFYSDTIIRCLDRKGAIAYLDRPPKKHGRPKTLLGATRPITIRLEKDCLDIIESMEGNPSKAIRRLLREQRV